jgi:flagellar biosynthesis/type III secretory pathway M-ring protein FliF/YscJ
LSQGGLLINISDQCDLKSILNQLDKKNIKYQVEYDKDEIKVLKLLY